MTSVEEILDEFDDEEEEQLGFSWNYLTICVILPALNGLLNGYAWSGLALHYLDMGWPIARSGWPHSVGFICRMVVQQIQLRCGFWVMIPFAVIHLGLAVLGLLYTTHEWAVVADIASMICFDAAITIEGLAFDIFGSSEDLARQASSTVLGVFTIANASGVTIGGLIYDSFGWKGCSAFHTSCQALELVLFLIQPVFYKSFREFFGKPESSELEQDADLSSAPRPKDGEVAMAAVLPSVPLPGAIEDIPEDGSDQRPGDRMTTISAAQNPRGTQMSAAQNPRGTQMSAAQNPRGTQMSAAQNPRGTQMSAAQNPRGTQMSAAQNPRGTQMSAAQNPRGSQASAARASHMSRQTRNTNATGHTGVSRHTRGTAGTSKSKATLLSRMTNLTSLKDSDHFKYHPGVASSLRPTVAQRAGIEPESPDQEIQDPSEAESKDSKGIPMNIRLPAALVGLCCFNNYLSYNTEFGTFAIYFKEYHGWNSATWASMAQTAGDLLASVMMKLLGNSTGEVAETPASCWRRLMVQPWSLASLLFLWMLCNAGMTSPWLPVAITAQVIMGTVFVYTCKMTTDLNLFYSLGDSKVFFTLQVYCKNVEAIAGLLAAFLGALLYDEISPIAPFVFTTLFSSLLFFIFTSGFCSRLGFADDIETAEEKRARRLGVNRMSTWKVESRTTQVAQS